MRIASALLVSLLVATHLQAQGRAVPAAREGRSGNAPAPARWVSSSDTAVRLVGRRGTVAVSPVIGLTRVPVGSGGGVRAVRIGMRFRRR